MLCRNAPIDGHRSREVEARCPYCSARPSGSAVWTERIPEPSWPPRAQTSVVRASPQRIAHNMGIRRREAIQLLEALTNVLAILNADEKKASHEICELLNRVANLPLAHSSSDDPAQLLFNALIATGLDEGPANFLSSRLADSLPSTLTYIEPSARARAALLLLAILSCPDRDGCPVTNRM